VAIARLRAEERHAFRLEPHDVVLVGDTPLDIAAAREGGARAVGVATGPYDTGELADAGADAVLADLSDPDAVLREVLA
jgi:phosphoglycolate phosphatase-like HAD superfamily hydrolase